MTTVADFTSIFSGATVTIGDGSNPNGWTESFNTAGRLGAKKAYLTLMLQHMTATLQNAVVKVNNSKVGELFNSKDGNALHWQTQMIVFDGGILNDGNNTIDVFPVDSANPSPGETRDDFNIREVVCHFHKEV